MIDIQQYNEKLLKKIKYVNAYNQKLCYGREVYEALEYTKWEILKKLT